MPVAAVLFTKAPEWVTGEAFLVRRFPELVSLHIMGAGFTWDTQDRARDIASARATWDTAKSLIRDETHKLVLRNELNIALRYDYLPVEKIVSFLQTEKPADRQVVITGCNAKPELIEIVGLATEMTLIKHPFQAGVKAQKDIEY